MGCESSQQVAQIQPYESRIDQSSPQFNQLITSKNFQELENMGDQYFKDGLYLDAIAVYKKMIESGYTVDFQIEGLGNFDIETNNFEWWVYKWYDGERQAGRFKGNAFDALSLCYCRIKESNKDELQKGVQWYEDMLCNNETYELYIGYANILYNKYFYDPALKAYNKVMKMRPTLLNAYVGVMFLYEFRRVEKPKAIAFANTVLAKDPNNMYAYFVLGRNIKDVDERIQKLKESAQKFPHYIRLVNEVGLSYGAKKDHKGAIHWYKKCLQIAPNDYAQGYNNVAYRTQMLQDYQEALNYYYKAVEIDAKYKMAFANAIKLFNKIKFTDEDIIKKIRQYPKMDEFNFYYYLGLAYYDLSDGKKTAITWYKRAEQLNENSPNLCNSMGLAYEALADYQNGQAYYLKSIKLDPKYKFPFYNMGLLFKHKNQVEKAIQWYQKAIQNDPSYHPPYNNLGNIYRDRQQYQKAIDLYKKCVQIHSTYTLVYCNMAMCYLKQEMYQDAFNAFARAKELLPTDNNGLSEANKAFLNENLAKFDQQGEKWRKTGSIDPEQKRQLQDLIRSFESNFKLLYSTQSAFKRSDDVVLKPTILQIVNLIYEDKFELKNIEKVFALIKHIFHDDEEYFHIIPQIFIQHFWTSTFTQNKPILEVERKLNSIIKDLSSKESSQTSEPTTTPNSNINTKMKNFNPTNDFKVNLFKNTAFFSSYEALYSEIDKVNKQAEKSLPQYIEFVDAVSKRSNGIPYGVNMKMPKRADQQFKVILRILQKMFKKEINETRVESIISKIDKQLRAGGKTITLINIVHEIMDVWTKEITLILKQREKNKVETTCTISDLLRGKLMFNSVADLEKAIEACDRLCHLKGYTILELDNRLSKPQTMDVVLKIQVNEAVCEFQLAMKQDQSKYHFIHSIYEIERSPLGCIFGSYLFMSKGFNYPLLANCKDIQQRLEQKNSKADLQTIKAAKYIINALEQK